MKTKMILAAAVMTLGISAMAKGTGDIGSVGTLKVDKHSKAIMKLATYKAYMSELKSIQKIVAEDDGIKGEMNCSELSTAVDSGAGYFSAEQTCTSKRTDPPSTGGYVDESIIKINFVGLYAELENGKEVYAIATISQEDISEE